MGPVQRRGLVGILIVTVLLGAASCTDHDAADTPSTTSAGLSARESQFCEAWNGALATGDDSAVIDVLADVPPELEEAAATVGEEQGEGPQTPAAGAAIAEILDWTELHCPRGEPGSSQRHVAPPVDTTFEGLAFCGTIGLPSAPPNDQSGMELYGTKDDPYAGAMLGVLWDPADGGGGHAGDGSGRSVTVRGKRGIAVPITVFQQTILPELGTVIAWSAEGRDLGLYGRQWPMERADELVEIANELEESEGRFRIPADALPKGYRRVFSGRPSVMSLVADPSALYALHYQGDDFGTLSLRGLQMTDEEFHAFRFLTLGIEPSEIAGRQVLSGNAWTEEGPGVVTWREPDGLVVRVVGIGVPLDLVRKVADQSRELTNEEWAALVEADSQCPERRPERPPPPRAEQPRPTARD